MSIASSCIADVNPANVLSLTEHALKDELVEVEIPADVLEILLSLFFGGSGDVASLASHVLRCRRAMHYGI